ncbi:MAG: N-acetylmuramoyl-L-alanine amidase, partial [Verrucomicrobia bacterium]|nr:N-acetylmuramoyl-L-alanine amidase [Verrucomicrobiota bacterium]
MSEAKRQQPDFEHLPVLIRISLPALALAAMLLTGCRTAAPLTFVPRQGDEIIVAGQLFHTGTRVVTWMDPGGYDAYRVERRFSPIEESGWEESRKAVEHLNSPNRYNLRRDRLTPEEIERIRGGGWDLPTLQKSVDQFVIHYDVCGISKQCFKVLHDMRGLSVHFMLDIDGTLYQTLDLKERAWHAGTANARSVGIEIAHMGAYRSITNKAFQEWYGHDEAGPFIRVPERISEPMILTPDFQGRPARAEPVRGVIQGTELVQYDFTPEQYDALIKLTAALCKVFPDLACDYPRDAQNRLIPHVLPEPQLKDYR